MRILAALIVVGSVIAPAWGAPCSTTAPGSTALEKAANGLGVRQWCEMTPSMLNFTQLASTVQDVLDACAGSANVNTYAHNMAYDPSQGTAGKLYWWGTTHGGTYRSVQYDIGQNQFTPSPTLTGQCGSTGSCQTDWETSPVQSCANCSANHAYDGMASDNNGSFYRMGFTSTGMWKITPPSSVNTNFQDCNGGNENTGAMDFWPDHGAGGTLVALCTIANNKVSFYDLSTGSWSTPFGTINWGGGSGNAHNRVDYHPGSGEVWITEGGGGPSVGKRHFRLWRNGSTPTLTELSPPPLSDISMVRVNSVADPADPSGKFIVMSMGADTVGTSNNGWWEYDMGTDTWTTFAALGINSMPPLYTQQGNLSTTPFLSVAIPDYGVAVWLSHRDDEGQDDGGMFLYKHTVGNGSGEVDPPQPPGNPQPF